MLPIGAGDRSSSSCAVALMGGDSQSSMTPGDVGPYTLPVVVLFVSSSPAIPYVCVCAYVCVCLLHICIYIDGSFDGSFGGRGRRKRRSGSIYVYIYCDVQVPPLPHTQLFFFVEQ